MTTWIKPELTVLLRSKAEEYVLNACKTTGSGASYGDQNSGCAYHPGSMCTKCEWPGSS